MGSLEKLNNSASTLSLAEQLPPLILGGAGFSYQLHSSPKSISVATIIRRAFDLGIRCIDTSPYYDPSETLLGEALSSPEVTSSYARSDYILMTKVGRISVDKFDYSAEWIRKSIAQSLKLLKTSYIDVVFVHDVEFMPLDNVLTAISTLVAIATEQPGVIRNIGISGYDLKSLTAVARLSKEHLHRPLDVVQVWARLSLQNSTLATDQQYGLGALRKAGVKCVCSSSPLAAGLLRDTGVPVGALGDWHPAPQGLREVCAVAARWLTEHSEEITGKRDGLASVALRYSIAKAWRTERDVGQGQVAVRTIVGVSSLDDLEANVKTAQMILKPSTGRATYGIRKDDELDEDTERQDGLLCQHIRKILGPWVDYDFSS